MSANGITTLKIKLIQNTTLSCIFIKKYELVSQEKHLFRIPSFLKQISPHGDIVLTHYRGGCKYEVFIPSKRDIVFSALK